MPDPIQIGDTGVKIVDIKRDYDPQSGWSTTITYEGEEITLTIMAPALRTKTSMYNFNGPVWRLAARYGDAQDGSDEIPFDKWHIDTEMAEISIWESAHLAELAGGEDNLSDLKQVILDAAEAKKSVADAGFGLFAPWVEELYVEYYVRGVRAFETKRPTLRRVRTISANYASPIEIVFPEPVYTTAKLKTTFGVPAAVAAQLPADPTFVPSGRVWAWKQRKETSETIPALNKVEEQIDWVFAPWSVLSNSLIS